MGKISAAILMLAAMIAAPGWAQRGVRANPGELILHQMTDYQGDFYRIDSDRTAIQTAWNIRSISIHEGETWVICARPRYHDCIELTRSVPDASAIGVVGQIGSARRIHAD